MMMKADAICIEGLLRWAAELSRQVNQTQKGQVLVVMNTPANTWNTWNLMGRIETEALWNSNRTSPLFWNELFWSEGIL